MNNLDTDLQNWPRSNVNMPFESPYTTFYLVAIVMFAIPVIVCKIITKELLKCTQFKFVTFKKVKVRMIWLENVRITHFVNVHMFAKQWCI